MAYGLFVCLFMLSLSYTSNAQTSITTELVRVERILAKRNIDSLRTLFASEARVYLGIKGTNSGYYSLEQTLAILDVVTRRSKPISFKVKSTNTLGTSATAIGELKVRQERGIVVMTAVLGFMQCHTSWCINRILLY
ncbi:MAG TPA: hypothetical protein VIX80_07105 [Candidatus Kapabacteria bacterium]